MKEEVRRIPFPLIQIDVPAPGIAEIIFPTDSDLKPFYQLSDNIVTQAMETSSRYQFLIQFNFNLSILI